MATSGCWADEIDEEGQQDSERSVSEIAIDAKTGQTKKILRTFQLEKKFVLEVTAQRKKWTKFGQSRFDPPGPKYATTRVADEVQMLFAKDGFKNDTNLFAMVNEGKDIIRCRICFDNHFTLKCPYKDIGIDSDLVTQKAIQLGLNLKPNGNDGKYIPPALRHQKHQGETTAHLSSKTDDTTIRISNLPESMSELDLQDLCNPFGKVARIFLPKNRTSGNCKGFAFVTYQSKNVAARALQMLHGYGYDYLILSVELVNNNSRK